ncbi:hypothetical protein SASPL_115404 [Salvia splendens]|uniref:DNA polymerase kappa n=1 Tax=Salvia splendens TaxID=180675 RepID=A0A8X8Y8A0_SALSN|nr:hypothetical protein SASPL_115404 [Salvia splendens]
MDQNPNYESMVARVQQLERERIELQKDIEQLCMQQAGPAYIGVATRLHFQRTAGLEQEIENLKKQLATCIRQNQNLQEELSEAYRIKSQIADLHKAEVSKNVEAENQLRFFQDCVAAAFAERDNAIMEVNFSSPVVLPLPFLSFDDSLDRRLVEELTAELLEEKEQAANIRIDFEKHERQNEIFREVIDKFYSIRQDSLNDSTDGSWEEKCLSLLNDSEDTWRFQNDEDASTSNYIEKMVRVVRFGVLLRRNWCLQNSLEAEIETLRRRLDNLQNKLRVGLEIETHLKKKVRDLERKKIHSKEKNKKWISALSHHHSQFRNGIKSLLDEGYSELKSISDLVIEKIKQLETSRECDLRSSQLQEREFDKSECRDVHVSADSSPKSHPGLPIPSACETGDASEALALALHDKVSALLLMSQQEERHLLERDVNAALQKKIEELQRNLMQVTNEKVKSLMELAQLKQELYILQPYNDCRKISQDKVQGIDPVETAERRMVPEKDGKLKSLLKKTYLTRWVGGSDGSDILAHLHNEKPHQVDFARMKIENATLKESLDSMEHLLSSVRRLRISLLKVKESGAGKDEGMRCSEDLEQVIAEANLLKTAFGSSLPVSWLAETERSLDEISGAARESGQEKVDLVSAAGFEMVELLIFAAQNLKECCGMEGVDKEKVQRVVYEMSKGIADRKIAGLEATRDLSRIWLHVDMDAFYAAVETLSNPSLEGKPMAVGSMSMLSTANYEARKFGVRAAIPGFIARKLCPELIFVPTDFKKYNHFSGLTRKVFERYDPNFLPASLDEAYLDITNFCNEKGMTGGQVAEELRESVHKETGLTCSAGLLGWHQIACSPRKWNQLNSISVLLKSRVCSDINKPNGQFVLPSERVAVVTFISSLPIRKIGGIGKVTENILKGVLGITTCEEMLQKSSFICALFSHASADLYSLSCNSLGLCENPIGIGYPPEFDFFLSVSLGIGRTDTPQASQRKSMSTERTFSPTGDKASIFQKLVEIDLLLAAQSSVTFSTDQGKNLSAVDLSENLSDLKKEGIRGRTLTLKLKTSSFEVRTQAVTLPYNTCSSEDILRQAKKLLKAELPVSLRLMGLRMSNFGEGREGVAADPKQKTLSNFQGADDASRRGLGAQVQSESTISDDALAIIDRESSLCSDIHEPSESVDFSDTYQIRDSEHTGTTHFHREAETQEAFDLQIDNFDEKVSHHDTVGAAADLLSTGTGRLVERDSSSGLCEQSSFDQHKRDCSNGEAGSSLNLRDTIHWLNDYQCSVCGTELPPSFIEERQEHFDFHLAERLQEEESSNRNRLVKPPNLRFVEKGDMSNRKKKKQKRSSPSQGKHIPIDAFFAKTSQNL